MKLSKKLVGAFALLALAFPAKSEPSQEVIDKCMKASDFQGCVNVLTGKTSTKQETKITVDLDKVRNTGNSCPESFAYVGSGYCKEFRCYAGYGGHDPRLGGKGNYCLNKRLNLQFIDTQPIRATTDERCPLVERQCSVCNPVVRQGGTNWWSAFGLRKNPYVYGPMPYKRTSERWRLEEARKRGWLAWYWVDEYTGQRLGLNSQA